MNAILLFSYGTLTSIDDAGDFFTHLMGSHATDVVIEQGKGQYRQIEMADPLSTTTNRIGRAFVGKLEKETDEKWQYYIGNKHTTPRVEEAVNQCVQDGAERIIAVCLNPFYSKTGADLYMSQAKRALKKSGAQIPLLAVNGYYQHKGFVDILARRLLDAYNWLPNKAKQQAEVIFTCHSMPGTDQTNEAFVTQYKDLAARLMKRLPVELNHEITYRSVMNHGKQKWLTPAFLPVMEEKIAGGAKAIIASELLSIVENVEAIEEVGMAGSALARKQGIPFVQMEYLNDSFDYVQFLLEEIKQKALCV